jgi:hypothetical protein
MLFNIYRKLRKDDSEFEAILGYIVRPSQKKNPKIQKKPKKNGRW